MAFYLMGYSFQTASSSRSTYFHNFIPYRFLWRDLYYKENII